MPFAQAVVNGAPHTSCEQQPGSYAQEGVLPVKAFKLNKPINTRYEKQGGRYHVPGLREKMMEVGFSVNQATIGR